MANTIKFGNGQWATKEDSILAYNDENANFKPLPFVTSRATIATRVNKAGLLETVASGVPRVDYLDNSKGSYLLEPTSRNLVTQSESFGNNYWTKSGASIEGDASTAGSELIDANASVFSGTSIYSWSSYGSNTVINVSNQLEITNIDNSFGASYPLRNSGDLSTDLIVGQLYKLEFRGSSSVDLNSFLLVSMAVTNTDAPLLTTTPKDYIIYFVAQGATSCNLRMQGMSINEVITLDNISVKEVQGFSAPSVDSPLGSFKLVGNDASAEHWIATSNIAFTSGDDYTNSCFVKKGELDKVQLTFSLSVSGGTKYANFDLLNGILGTVNGGSATITSVGDFYKCSFTMSATATANGLALISLTNSLTSVRLPVYNESSSNGLYIFGAQLEQQSYATSYIPTKGSQITRLAESASQTVPDGIINSSEGVLYFDGSALSNDGTSRAITIRQDGGDFIKFLYSPTSNRVDFVSFSSGALSCNITKVISNTTDNAKFGLKWKQNDFALWINGVEVGQDLSGNEPLGLNKISFTNEGGSASNFYGNIKDLRVYNTALTDAQLQILTTI